ncbi:MAG TPA: hypothetical protein PLK30_24310 [Blastocatellia bacterium]|nr:hypothetical protein [Blastocatellia bacterium]
MKTITCLVLSFFLMATPIIVRADQKSERIRFERGRTSAVIKAAITNSEQENVHEYKLRVAKKQTIIVHLASTEKAATFMLAMPEGSMASDGKGKSELRDWEGLIPASGDVVVSIYHKGKARSMPYTLEVTVR